MIYLACPYAHDDPAVRAARFDMACRAASALLARGVYVFSPISHSHHLDAGSGMSHSDWLAYDRWYIERCTEVWVLMVEGWDHSLGVAIEVGWARELGLGVKYLSLTEVGIDGLDQKGVRR